MSDREARLEDLQEITGNASISELEECTELSLYDENLTSVPPGVCDLTGLVELSLCVNQLSSLPPEISQLTGLTYLNIQNNQLSSLPPEISQLTGLTYLDIQNNQLSSLPPEISQLTGLTYLDIQNNQLLSLPPEILQLTGLNTLHIQNNQLSSLPPEISQLTGLTYLDIGENRLSSLPPEILRLMGLTRLYVDRNPIEELPPQITALTNLSELYIEWEGRMTIKGAPRGITNLPCWNNTTKPYSEMTYSFADALQKLQLYDLVDTADEEAKHDFLHEKELQFVQAQRTIHPGLKNGAENLISLYQAKANHKPFAEGEVFLLQSPTATAVSSADGEFYIEQSHVEVLKKGCYGNASLKDQHKRRDKLAKIGVVLEATTEPFTIENDEGTAGEQEEVKVIQAEINACLAGGLCAICFSQYKDPRLLPCNHVFCSECIKISIITSKEEPPFRCPLCFALAYVDEKTVGELKPFTYDSAALGGMYASLEGGKDKGTVMVLKCLAKTKGVKCTEDAIQYCVVCREKGVYCGTHSEMHIDTLDETHAIKELQFGAVPRAKKIENCLIHRCFPTEFYCPSCPESPLKCAKCALNDRTHLDEHQELNQEGSDTKTIITERIRALCVVERKLGLNIKTIEKGIKDVERQNEEKASELDSFVKDLEDQVARFKEQSKKQLESLNQSIIAPLKESQKKLFSEMHRIHIAKQTLTKILHKEGSENSLIQTGNALRFANQVLYSKHNPPIHIAPASIVSKIPRTIINNLKKLNDSFMFGLSTTKTEDKQEAEATEMKLESLHPIITASSIISAVARAIFDSSSSTEKIEFPWGICVHPENGNIYATDEDLQSVHIFDKNLKLLSSHYSGLIIPKTLHGPRGIAISNDGLIAIADCEGHEVMLYTDEFTFAKSIGGQKGSKEGQFIRPYSVAFDSEGNLYVADSGNMRVQKFNSKGEFISAIGNQTEKGGLITSLVNGVCVNEEDQLLVLCAGSDQVRVFSKDSVIESYVKLEVPTSVEGWSHIFRASRGVFGVCENKTGAITFYNYEGKVQHRISLDGCIGACFGLDGALYATSLSNKSISMFSASSE